METKEASAAEIDRSLQEIDLTEAVRCVLLDPAAKIPVKSSSGAAGFDLFSTKKVKLGIDEWAEVNIGVCLQIPDGYFGCIRSRSGLMFKNRVAAFQGTIDSDYRGPITVLLYNGGEKDVQLDVGDRIAQIIIEKIHPKFEMLRVGALEQSIRNNSGFGSTGP